MKIRSRCSTATLCRSRNSPKAVAVQLVLLILELPLSSIPSERETGCKTPCARILAKKMRWHRHWILRILAEERCDKMLSTYLQDFVTLDRKIDGNLLLRRQPKILGPGHDPAAWWLLLRWKVSSASAGAQHHLKSFKVDKTYDVWKSRLRIRRNLRLDSTNLICFI